VPADDNLSAFTALLANSNKPTVSRDIIQSDASTFNRENKVKPSLSTSEKARAASLATIYWETYYKVAAKHANDVKGETAVAKAQQAAGGANNKGGAAAKLPSGGLGGFGTIALIAAGIFALAAWLKDYLGPVGVFLTKLPFRLKGLVKSFEIIKDLFKVFRETKLGTILAEGLKPVAKFFEFFKGSKIGKFFVKIGEKIAGAFNVFKKVGGAVKGVFKGEGFLGKILKGLMKTVGGKIMKVLRFLPFVGGIVQLGFAYSFWKEGKPIRAVFELLSAILMLTGIGTPIALALDGALLLYDLYEANQSKTESTKVDGSKGKGILDTIKEKMSSVLSGKLRYLPLIGGLVYFGDAIAAFSAGDWKGGLKDLGLGILGTIGGQGLIDGLNWVISFFDTPEERTTMVDNTKGIFEKIKSGISSALSGKLEYLPIIGGFKYFGDAIAAFSAGDWVGGLKSLGLGILGTIGGQGLIDGIMWVSSLLQSTSVKMPEITMPSFDFIKGLWDKVTSVVGDVISNIWKWVKDKFQAVSDGIKSAISYLPGGSALMSKLNIDVPSGNVPVAQSNVPQSSEMPGLKAGVTDEIAKSNVYLKELVMLTARSEQYLKHIAKNASSGGAPIVVPSGGSSAPSLPAPTLGGTILDSRGDYYRSAYSINVPPALA
jgi:hypothetical protein